jgi:hypothetical protein
MNLRLASPMVPRKIRIPARQWLSFCDQYGVALWVLPAPLARFTVVTDEVTDADCEKRGLMEAA